MAIAQAYSPDQLILVSSLYGPGTMVAWYLTIVSVLLSWTLHPQKRTSGSIDADLIAVLTLPAVSAGHVLSQIRRWPILDSDALEDENVYLRSVQTVAAVEASFNVVETSMAIIVILFHVAIRTLCVRRAVAVALVGLLCFAVECYIHFSNFVALTPRREKAESGDRLPTFTRYFVADFVGLVVAIAVILSGCALMSTLIAYYMLTSSKTSTRHEPELAELTSSSTQRSVNQTGEIQRLGTREEHRVHSITLLSVLFLPAGLSTCIAPAFGVSVDLLKNSSAAPSRWHVIRESATRLAQEFLPRTASSILDLDQTVAVIAGATVLVFEVYSVAAAQYKARMSRSASSTEEANGELHELRDRLAP